MDTENRNAMAGLSPFQLAISAWTGRFCRAIAYIPDSDFCGSGDGPQEPLPYTYHHTGGCNDTGFAPGSAFFYRQNRGMAYSGPKYFSWYH
jgi:hypothetical protein